MAGAVASLVAVGIGQDADAIALLDGVADQPFEGAPVGMDLDRALDPGVVRHLDVGVAAADVGEHDAVLVLQRLEEMLGAVGIGRDVGDVVDQRMRGAVDLAALVHEHDVAVAAEAGIARPFVAREDDEAAVLVELPRQPVQLVPEGGGDLEVVALVAHAVEEGLVARELHQVARRVGADRLLRLAVQVAPVGAQRRLGGDAQRIAAADDAARPVQHVDQQIARLCHRQAADLPGRLAAAHREALGQARDRQAGAEREAALDLVAGIAPGVLALEAQAEGLAGAAQGGQQRLPRRRRAGDDGEARLPRQLDIIVGGEGVDQHAELEGRLDEGLHAHAGRAVAAIAEAHRDRVALVQEAAHDADHQRLVPRPDVQLGIVAHVEHGAVGGLDGRVVRALGIVELRPAHVAGEALHDLDRAGVVDAEVAGRVDQRDRLEAAGLDRPGDGEGGGAHALRQVGRMRHGRPR